MHGAGLEDAVCGHRSRVAGTLSGLPSVTYGVHVMAEAIVPSPQAEDLHLPPSTRLAFV